MTTGGRAQRKTPGHSTQPEYHQDTKLECHHDTTSTQSRRHDRTSCRQCFRTPNTITLLVTIVPSHHSSPFWQYLVPFSSINGCRTALRTKAPLILWIVLQMQLTGRPFKALSSRRSYDMCSLLWGTRLGLLRGNRRDTIHVELAVPRSNKHLW